MIKAFLFDYGGVMTAGGGGNELSERLAGNIGVTDDEAWDLLMPVWGEFARGKITEADFWRSIEANFGHPITVEQRNIWNKWHDMKPLPEMVGLVNDLSIRGLEVGLLSTVIPNTACEIKERGGYDIFDFCILSFENGFAKPEPEAYHQALEHLDGVIPPEVVFIDDQEMCLVPARKLGMKTILFKNPTQAIAEIGDLAGI